MKAITGPMNEPERPKEYSIESAKGGFIGRRMGGKHSYNSEQIVKEDLEGILKDAKKWLATEKDDD